MERIDYLEARAGVHLAYKHRPGRGPTLIFLPGYASDMAGGKASALDAWAAAEGRAMLRFDYGGCGLSGGDFEAQTLAGWRDDALAMIDRVAEGPVVPVGSSMGGWLMLLVALARPERVAALVGIAAAPDFTGWGYSEAEKLAILRDGRIEQAQSLWRGADRHHPRLLGKRRGAPPRPCADRDRLPGAADPRSGRHRRVVDLGARTDAADPFSRRADDPGQGRRPPPVARRRSRAADRHCEDAAGAPVSLTLLFLALQAPSLPSSPDPMPPRRPAPTAPATPPPAPPADAAVEARYRSCVDQVRADAEAAVAAADAWRAQGGGLHARQCLGLALVASSAGSRRRRRSSRRRARPRRRGSAPRRFLGPGGQCLGRGGPAAARARRRSTPLCWRRASPTGCAARSISTAPAPWSRLGNAAGARAEIDRALQLVPADPFAWYLSAALARRDNNLARAGIDIARARELAPDNPDILLLAGTLAGLAGNMEEAERIYRRIVAAAPDSDAGRAARESLATLREVEVPAPTPQPQSR